jgi:mannosyltransferase
MTASTLTRTPGSRIAHAGLRAPAWAATLSAGVFGALVSLIAIGTPSFWGDEAASVLSAERSLPSLFRMLGSVDAVHGTYYLFLHFWIRVFGTSETAVRVPSALAIGAVVAGVYLLASRLGSRRVAVIAALLCAFLPRIVVNGGEARSYAISTAIAVWSTVLLVSLVRRGETRRRVWIAYGAVVAIGIYFFLYLALMLAVHAVIVISHRGIRRRWLQATVLALVAAIPIAAFGYAERDQIAFLGHRNYAQPHYILISQWFGNPLFAVPAWACVAGALVAGVVAWRRGRRPSALALVAVPWLVLPTALLLCINLISPSYNLRYLSMSAPAVSIVLALGIVALRRRWMIVAATIAMLGLALPADIAARGPFAKDGGSDWRQASQYIASIKQPGEAIVFDETERPSRAPRLAKSLYPSDYAGLADIELLAPAASTAGLWDEQAPLTDVSGQLVTRNRVILVEVIGSHDHGTRADQNTLESVGFTQASARTIHRTIVYEFTRGN